MTPDVDRACAVYVSAIRKGVVVLKGAECVAFMLFTAGCGILARDSHRAMPVLPPAAAVANPVADPVPAVSESAPPAAVAAPEMPSEPEAVANGVPDVDPDNKDTYRVRAGDTIHLQVTGEDDISGDFKVSADGTILHPLLGRVTVGGATVTALERDLTASLAKDYLVNPKVYVDVRSSVLRRVILFGEAKSPGVYELPVGERFTLLQLIAKAGGFSDVAATDRVRVVRRGKGGDQTFQVNVSNLLRGRGPDKDLELLPNDVVTIPQTVF